MIAQLSIEICNPNDTFKDKKRNYYANSVHLTGKKKFSRDFHHNDVFKGKKQNYGNMLQEYILKYCSPGDSLKELELSNVGNAINAIEKPFKNVEVVRFLGGFLGENICNLNKWFPKMRHLELKYNKFSNIKNIEILFPSLEHLTIYVGRCFDKSSISNIEAVISLNPQLRSISSHSK